MIGMGFLSFLTLLGISFVAAMIVHNGFRYRFLGSVDGFLGKWIVAWVGAWIASPVLGYWFGGVSVGNQYVIPALIGAFSGAFMTTAVCKAVVKMRTSGIESAETATAAPAATEVGHETKAA